MNFEKLHWWNKCCICVGLVCLISLTLLLWWCFLVFQQCHKIGCMHISNGSSFFFHQLFWKFVLFEFWDCFVIFCTFYIQIKGVLVWKFQRVFCGFWMWGLGFHNWNSVEICVCLWVCMQGISFLNFAFVCSYADKWKNFLNFSMRMIMIFNFINILAVWFKDFFVWHVCFV